MDRPPSLTRRVLLTLAAAAAAGGSIGAAPRRRRPEPITVFAAASLTDVLKAAGEDYERRTGGAVRFSFAGSGAIARQVEQGAPADIFISADAEWMDYLQTRGLIRNQTRRNIAGNALVLIAPADRRISLRIGRGFRLSEALGGGRLATGDPQSVPVGRYAREALTNLGVWPKVADRLASTDNVRAALLFVARGEAPLGVVYRTDALSERGVRIVDAFPASSHAPIIYPAALTRDAKPDAQAFLSYLEGPGGQAQFRRFGFSRP